MFSQEKKKQSTPKKQPVLVNPFEENPAPSEELIVGSGTAVPLPPDPTPKPQYLVDWVTKFNNEQPFVGEKWGPSISDADVVEAGKSLNLGGMNQDQLKSLVDSVYGKYGFKKPGTEEFFYKETDLGKIFGEGARLPKISVEGVDVMPLTRRGIAELLAIHKQFQQNLGIQGVIEKQGTSKVKTGFNVESGVFTDSQVCFDWLDGKQKCYTADVSVPTMDKPIPVGPQKPSYNSGVILELPEVTPGMTDNEFRKQYVLSAAKSAGFDQALTNAFLKSITTKDGTIEAVLASTGTLATIDNSSFDFDKDGKVMVTEDGKRAGKWSFNGLSPEVIKEIWANSFGDEKVFARELSAAEDRIQKEVYDRQAEYNLGKELAIGAGRGGLTIAEVTTTTAIGAKVGGSVAGPGGAAVGGILGPTVYYGLVQPSFSALESAARMEFESALDRQIRKQSEMSRQAELSRSRSYTTGQAADAREYIALGKFISEIQTEMKKYTPKDPQYKTLYDKLQGAISRREQLKPTADSVIDSIKRENTGYYAQANPQVFIEGSVAMSALFAGGNFFQSADEAAAAVGNFIKGRAAMNTAGKTATIGQSLLVKGSVVAEKLKVPEFLRMYSTNMLAPGVLLGLSNDKNYVGDDRFGNFMNSVYEGHIGGAFSLAFRPVAPLVRGYIAKYLTGKGLMKAGAMTGMTTRAASYVTDNFFETVGEVATELIMDPERYFDDNGNLKAKEFNEALATIIPMTLGFEAAFKAFPAAKNQAAKRLGMDVDGVQGTVAVSQLHRIEGTDKYFVVLAFDGFAMPEVLSADQVRALKENDEIDIGGEKLKLADAATTTEENFTRLQDKFNAPFRYLIASITGIGVDNNPHMQNWHRAKAVINDGEPMTLQQFINIKTAGGSIQGLDDDTISSSDRSFTLLRYLEESNSDPSYRVRLADIPADIALALQMIKMKQQGFIEFDGDGFAQITEKGKSYLDSLQNEVAKFRSKVDGVTFTPEEAESLAVRYEQDQDKQDAWVKFTTGVSNAFSPADISKMTPAEQEVLADLVASGEFVIEPESFFVYPGNQKITLDNGKVLNLGAGITGRRNKMFFELGQMNPDDSVARNAPLEEMGNRLGIYIPQSTLDKLIETHGDGSNAFIEQNDDGDTQLVVTDSEGNEFRYSTEGFQYSDVPYSLVPAVINYLQMNDIAQGTKPKSTYSKAEVEDAYNKAKRGWDYWKTSLTNYTVPDPRAPKDRGLGDSVNRKQFEITRNLIDKFIGLFKPKGEGTFADLQAQGDTTVPTIQLDEIQRTQATESLRQLGYTDQDINSMTGFEIKTLSDNSIPPAEREQFVNTEIENRQSQERQSNVTESDKFNEAARTLAQDLYSNPNKVRTISPTEYDRMSNDEKKVVKSALKTGDLKIEDGAITNGDFKGTNSNGVQVNFGSRNINSYLINEIGKAFSQNDTDGVRELTIRLAEENNIAQTEDNLDSLFTAAISDYDAMTAEIDAQINSGATSVNVSDFQTEAVDGFVENNLAATSAEVSGTTAVELPTKPAPVPTKGPSKKLTDKAKLNKIANKDIRWSNANVPEDLGPVVFIRDRKRGLRGRKTYLRNKNGEYVNTADSTDVISAKSLSDLISTREVEYGVLKDSSLLYSSDSDIEVSQSRTDGAAEAIGGQAGIQAMDPLKLSRAQVRENERSFRNGKGWIHVTKDKRVYYEKNSEYDVWSNLRISGFAVDENAPGQIFLNSRLMNIVMSVSEKGWSSRDIKSVFGVALHTDRGASLEEGYTGIQTNIKALLGNKELQDKLNLTEDDLTTLSNLLNHIDNLPANSRAVAITQLNPALLSDAMLVRSGQITGYRKFESTVRHEFLHKLLIEELGFELINDTKFRYSIQNKILNNPAWGLLLEHIDTKTGYGALVESGDISGVIQEVLAHGSDYKSLLSGLGIEPGSVEEDMFFSVYYDILSSLNESHPNLAQKLGMYTDPEISNKVNAYYEANRLENYSGSPETGGKLVPRGSDSRSKISDFVRGFGKTTASRPAVVWEGSGEKRVTIRRVEAQTPDFVRSDESTFLVDVANASGTFPDGQESVSGNEVSLTLIDLATDEEANAVFRNSTKADAVAWAVENGYDGFFNSSAEQSYVAEIFNNERTAGKLEQKASGLYSIDLEYRDGLTFLTNKQYEESKKNHEKGEGPVHITSTLIIDPKTSGMGVTDAPKFIVDRGDNGIIAVNLGLQMVIDDVTESQVTIGNPDRETRLMGARGLEVTNRRLFGYSLVAGLSDAYLNNSPVFQAHGQHFPLLSDLVKILTGQDLADAVQTMSSMTVNDIVRVRETEVTPVLFVVNRPDSPFDLSRAAVFHESTHRIVDEIMGDNLFTALQKAGIDMMQDPAIQKMMDVVIVGSPYESIRSQLPSVAGYQLLQEILAFPASGADTLISLGVTSDPQDIKTFVDAYTSIIRAIAQTKGYMTAVDVARYAAPDFTGIIDKIYADQQTQLPTIGIARKPATVSGGRGLFSRDVGTRFEFTNISKVKALKGPYPTVTLVNGVDLDYADLPQEVRLRLKDVVRFSRFEPIEKVLADVQNWHRKDLKDTEDEIARVRMLLLGSDGLSEISAMLYSTAEPDESMSDEYGEQYYDEPYRGHVSVDRASGLITLRAPSLPFYRDLNGLRVNSVEEGMTLLRQARLSELEVERIEKKTVVDFFDSNPSITEYFDPQKDLGKDMGSITPEELAERTYARAVASRKFLRSMDSPIMPATALSATASPLVGISMADLADMTRRGLVLNKLMSREDEPGAYYAAMKYGPDYSELSPVLAVEVARIMTDTMKSRRNLPEFKGKDMLSPEVFPTWAGPLIDMGLAPSSVQRDPKGFMSYATQLVKNGIEIPGYMTSQMVGNMMFSLEGRFPLIPPAVLKHLGDLALSTSDVEFDALMTYDSLKEMANLMDDPGLMDDTTISSILRNQGPLLRAARQYAKLHVQKNGLLDKMPPSKRGLMSRDLAPIDREYTKEELQRAAIENTIYKPAVERVLEPVVAEKSVLINGKSWEDIEAPTQLKDLFQRMQKFDNPPTSAEQIISDLEKNIKRWEGEKLGVTNQKQIDGLNNLINGAKESIEWLNNNPITLMEVAREEADPRVYRKPAEKQVPNYMPTGMVLGSLIVRDWEYSSESYKVSLARRVRKPESDQTRLDRQRKLSQMTPAEIEAAYPEYFRLFNPGQMARFGNSVWSFMVGYADIETRYRMINPRFFEPKSSTEYDRAPSQEAIDFAINRVEEFHDVALAYVETRFDETRGGFVTPWTELGKDSSAYVRLDLDSLVGAPSTIQDIETTARGVEDIKDRTAGLTNRRLGRNREVTRLLDEAKDASKKGGGLMSRDIEVDEANVSVIDGFYDNAEAFINGFNPKNMTPHNKNLPNKAPGSQWLTIFTNAPGITQDNLEWNGLVSFLLANANTTLSKDDIIEYLKTSRITTETRVRRSRMFDDEDDSIIYDQERYSLKGRIKQMFELLVKTPGRIKGLTRQIMPTLSEQDLPENHVLKYRPNSRFYQEWVVVYVHPETGYEYPIVSAATKELALGRFYRDTSKIGNQSYQDSHWQGEENVNSQVRAAVYESSNGEEVALINEIQSDIHQAEVHEGTVPALTRQELKEASDRAATRISEVLKNNARFVNDGMKFHKDMLMAMAALRGRIAGSEYAQDWVQEGGKDGRALIEAKFGKDADLNSPEVVRFILENGLLTVSGLLERDILASPDMEVVINDYRGMADFYTQLRVEQELSARSRNKSASTDFTVGETPGPVPETPFSQNWMAVALKRAVAHFVQLGHDTIHWTTGMQQLNRYEDDLRQQVDALEYEVESTIVDPSAEEDYDKASEAFYSWKGPGPASMSNPAYAKAYQDWVDASDNLTKIRKGQLPMSDRGRVEKTFIVSGVKDGTRTTEMVFDSNGYTEMMTPAGDMRSVSMAAMIGKNMADKIMKSGVGTGSLSGPDLTIGGGLYFHVYDKMLPQLFKKIYGVEPVKTKVDLGDSLNKPKKSFSKYIVSPALEPSELHDENTFNELKSEISKAITTVRAVEPDNEISLAVVAPSGKRKIIKGAENVLKALLTFYAKMDRMSPPYSDSSAADAGIVVTTEGLPLEMIVKPTQPPNTRVEVWSAKLTPEMVARVKKGQSLYSRDSDIYESQLEMARTGVTKDIPVSIDELVAMDSSNLTKENFKDVFGKQFAMISAYRPGMTQDELKRRMWLLKTYAAKMGFKIVPTDGIYGGTPESSFFIYGNIDNFEEAIDALAGAFMQDSVLHGKDGEFYMREYKKGTISKFDSGSLDLDDTGTAILDGTRDGSLVNLRNGVDKVYFNLDIDTLTEQGELDVTSYRRPKNILSKYRSKLADPRETADTLAADSLQNQVAIQLLNDGQVDPKNPPVLKDEMGNIVATVSSKMVDGEISYFWTATKYLDVDGKIENPLYSANGDKETKFSFSFMGSERGVALYRAGKKLYTYEAAPFTAANRKAAYRKMFSGVSEGKGRNQKFKLDDGTLVSLEEFMRLNPVKDSELKEFYYQNRRQSSRYGSLTMAMPGGKTYRILNLHATVQNLFNRDNPDLVSQRPPLPRASDFPKGIRDKAYKQAMTEYREKIRPILVSHIVKTVLKYGATSPRTDFYFNGKDEFLSKVGKTVEQFDSDIGKMFAAMAFGALSANTSLKQNTVYLMDFLQGLATYYQTGELMPVFQMDGGGKVSLKKLGAHAGDIISISMLMQGYIPVRPKSPEYKILFQKGKLSLVSAGEVLRDAGEEISKEKLNRQYVKSELLETLQAKHGPALGAIMYLTTNQPGKSGSSYAEAVFGPKVGSFVANMLGYTASPTLDLWMRRYLWLLEGRLFKDNGDGSFEYADAGQFGDGDAEMEFYKSVFRDATDALSELGVTDATTGLVQTLPWVLMIESYNEHITTDHSVTSLDEAFRETMKDRDIDRKQRNAAVDAFLRGDASSLPDYIAYQSELGRRRSPQEAKRKILASRDSDALQAQQELLAANDQKLADMDADAWIAVAERLVTHGKLADTEIRAIRLLAERGDMDDMRTYIMGLSKQSVWELFVNVGRVSLLLGLRNIQKNIGGNSLRQFMDEISRVPASVLDIVLMHFNKAIGGTNMDRSTTSLLTNPLDTLAAWKYALTKGVTEGGKEFIEILRGEDMNVVFEHPSLFRERTTGIRFLKPLEKFEQLGWRFQGAMDRPFNATAFYRTLHELQTMRMREEHKKGNMITFEQAEEYLTVADYELAEMYALAATYQKKNVVSDKYYAMIDGLPPVFRAIISNITKFVKTPLNVVDYILDYTGLWPIAKLVHREYGTEDWISWKNSIKRVLDNPQDRKIISMAISQGAIGSLITFIGYKMGLVGMLMAFFDREEKKEGEQMEAKGTSWGEFSIAGKSVDISWLSPVSFYLVMGATMAQTDQTYERKLGELTDKYNQAVEEGDAAATEKAKQELDKHKNSSPFHEKVSRIFKNLALQTPFLRQLDEIKTAYDQNNLLPGLADKWFSPEVYVPAIVKEIARTKDEFDRVVSKEDTTERLTEKVQAAVPSLPGIRRIGKMLEDTGIPGVRNVGKVLQGREALPVKYDMYGRPIRTGAGYSAFAGTELNVDKLTSEMDRLNVSISKPVGATAAEENRLRKEKGELYAPKLLAITESPEYKKSDDKTKKRILESAIRTIGDEQRNQKLTDEEERHNLKIVTDREYYRTQIKTNPGQFARETTITDKDTIRSFAGGRLEPTVSFTQVLDDIRKTKNLDQWLNAKFNYEFLASERQPLALAQANYQEFVKDPQSFIIRLWARDKQYDQSQKTNQERRQELFREGKSKEEVEKQLRKESNRRGVETRRRQGSIKQITVTK